MKNASGVSVGSPARAGLFLGCLLTAGCASTPARTTTPSAAPSTAPSGDTTTPTAGRSEEDLRRAGEARIAELLAPEATAPLGPQAVDLPALNFHAVAQGTGAATVTTEGEVTMVRVPIGGQDPLTCIVYREAVDVANAVRTSFESVRRENANIEVRSVDAGFVGDTPFVDAQFLYLAGTEAQRLLGHLKIRSANVNGHGVVCLHDQPGYVATFDRATRAIFAEPQGSPRPERFVTTLDGHTCGVTVVRTGPTPNGPAGQQTEVSLTAMLIARSAQDLVASDHVDIEQFNRAGELVDMRVDKDENSDESTYHLRRLGAAPRYHVEGRHMGREIAGDFTAASALAASTAALGRAQRALTAARAPATLDLLAYHSGNPLAATTETYRVDRAVDAQHTWLHHHAESMESRILVGNGRLDQVEMDVGGHALAIRRVTE